MESGLGAAAAATDWYEWATGDRGLRIRVWELAA